MEGKFEILSNIHFLSRISMAANHDIKEVKFPYKKDWFGFEYLDFSYNENLSFFEFPKRVDKLYWLSLSNCNLKTISKRIGDTAIKQLYLDNNQLTSLPNSIWKCKDIQSLSLKNNKLSELPKSFKNIKSLRILSLEKNEQLKDISKLYSCGKNEKIIIKDNNIFVESL